MKCSISMASSRKYSGGRMEQCVGCMCVCVYVCVCVCVDLAQDVFSPEFQ